MNVSWLWLLIVLLSLVDPKLIVLSVLKNFKNDHVCVPFSLLYVQNIVSVGIWPPYELLVSTTHQQWFPCKSAFACQVPMICFMCATSVNSRSMTSKSYILWNECQGQSCLISTNAYLKVIENSSIRSSQLISTQHRIQSSFVSTLNKY